jgi:hypothetical protein
MRYRENAERMCARKTERLTSDSPAPAAPPWAAELGKYPFITDSVRTIADAVYARILVGEAARGT